MTHRANNPLQDNSGLAVRLYRIASLIAVIITLIPPVGYFWITYQSHSEGMQVESRLYAAFITQVMHANPKQWQADIQTLIEDDLTPTDLPETRSFTNHLGTTVAEVTDNLLWPVISRTAQLRDTHIQHTGKISIQRSLYPVVLSTILITLGSGSIGFAIFLILYTLPIRALNRTLLALQNEKNDAQEQKERLKAIIDHANEGIVTLDEQRRVESFNAAAEHIFGYSAAAVIGMPATIFMPHSFEDFNTRHETTGLHVSGKEFPLEITQSKTQVHGNSRIICIVHDITQRKAAEAELMQHRQHLQELVNAQTSDLIIAKEKAEAASRTKSDFLSTMSHEIRTPINAILGMTYLALKTTLNSKQKDYLDKAYQSGQHLLHIVNEILDFSKIEKGKLQIEAVDFKLDDLISNVTSIIADGMARKGLRLEVNTHDVPRVLRGDPLRIGQILINLAGNAVKFTDQGEIRINLHLLENHGDTLRIRFEVVDTGIGISAKALDNLFQPFLQADTSITRKYGGTGLGLAICKLLVKLMDGEIGVQSKLGNGSTFWFTLTLGRGDTARLPPDKGYISFVSSTILKGIRILLAEDNLFNQEIATEILQSAGAIVCVASNGLETIDLLNKENFDLILMDVQMPEMDGIEATRIIRSNALYRHLPIIALTANASNEDRAVCLACGMDEFIAKPVQPDQLSGIVAKLIAQDRITKGDPQ